MQGLQPFYLAALVPIHLHLQHRHLAEVPMPEARSAQAALVRRRKHVPVGLEERNWRQPAKKSAAPTSHSQEPITMVMGSTAQCRRQKLSLKFRPQLEDESRKLSVRGAFSCLVPGRS